MKRPTLPLLLCLLALLSGCAPQHTPQQESASPAPVYGTRLVQFSEEPGSFFLSETMDTAETSHALYCFDPLISQAQQQAVVTEAETLFSALLTPVEGLTLCFYAPETYACTYSTPDTLYTCLTEDFSAKVLLTLSQGTGHYGTAYGLAALLLGQEGAVSLPKDSALLDMNLLCFDSSFADEEDITALKGLAVDFARQYARVHGQEALETLCFSADKNALSSALSDYYSTLSLAYTPVILPFAYGGAGYAYKLVDESVAFYVDRGWQDIHRDTNPLVYEGFLLSRYGDVQAFFATNLSQMEAYREFFRLEKYQEGLQVFFPKSTSSAPTSYYKQGTHSLYIYNVDSLMHEYIHALTQPARTMSLWEAEGFARYYSYRYDAYGLAFLNADYNSAPDTPATHYVYEYKQTVGRDIDMAMDYKALEHMAVYSRGYTSPNDSYAAGSSFVGYLAEAFGDEAVIDALYGSGTPLPASKEALVQGWQAYLQANYGG